ncbi:hypothetical protein [Globicatella sp. PHS-GS-PNBC-21-1553]|uniref:hypothetical protein n=1 Tax=Globicatella sp. PHS-GS-PNBC-21-1553 TaxID=2885764 RepID=UPI00298EF885|nr:hypothetical protein [Globicatella sp. PHS-GS-PNBC-21-1553]WPC08756.1 hypothetical protein LB888_00410 [Globicatella sp. PHS-GS-PNBC-21-1553]
MGIDEILLQIITARYGREVRQAIHDGIKQAYDDAIKNGNANMEVSQARGSYPSLNSRLDEVDNKQSQITAQLAQKANQAFVDSQFSSIVSGAPKGTYTDLASLQTAYPSGAEGVFLVLESGHWYYWNSTTNAWTDGGLYQSGGGDWLAAMTEQDQTWSVI